MDDLGKVWSGGSAQPADDTLEVRLYPDTEEDGAGLGALLAQCLEFLRPLMADYLWHHAPLTLELAPDRTCLQGRLRFGDSIGDEWFATELLFRLSRRLPHCCLSLTDSDGEFLLIEAAMQLPQWLSPSNSAHRVFVRGGTLHLLPLTPPPAAAPVANLVAGLAPGALVKALRKPTLAGALQLVRTPEAVLPTAAGADVNTTIAERLAEARRVAREENAHLCRALLPPGVAHVLQHDPALVSAAVAAFYDREPKAAQRVCSSMRAYPPAKPWSRTVRLTRCMYAQLAQQQQFRPPRCFEAHLPQPVCDAALLGVKLACGFELLVHGLKQCGEQTTGAETGTAAAARRAKEIGMRPVDETQLSVDSAMAEARPDDSVAWMNVDRDELEGMLTARYGAGGGAGQGADSAAEAVGSDDDEIEGMTGSGSDDKDSDEDSDDSDGDSDDGSADGGDYNTGRAGGDAGFTGGAGAQQLRDVADAMHAFVGAESDLEGVSSGRAGAPAAAPVTAAASKHEELPAIAFDETRFWELLQGAPNADIGSDSSDEGMGGDEVTCESDQSYFTFGGKKEVSDTDASDTGAVVEAETVVAVEAPGSATLRGEGFGVLDEETSAGEGEGRSGSDSDDGSAFGSDADSDDDSDDGVRAMQEYMDAELQPSTLGQSFLRHAAPVPPAPLAEDAEAEDPVDLAPVDLDLNLVTHLLESFSLQQGTPGPASTLLCDMGVVLPAPERLSSES